VGKRKRQSGRPADSPGDDDAVASIKLSSKPDVAEAHPPVRRPALLVVSIVLLAAWLVFLLVTALRG